MNPLREEKIKQAVRCAYGTAASLRPDEDLVDLQNSLHAITRLQPSETVLDLGSGGGTDCFQAAQQVGPEGRVIGLDMTPEMIKLARHRAKEIGATNVEFRYGEIEDIDCAVVNTRVRARKPA